MTNSPDINRFGLSNAGSEDMNMTRSGRPDSTRANQAALRLQLQKWQPDANTVVLSIAGDIDLASSSVLQQGIQSCFSSGGRTVVLDLSGVEFLGSAGLSMLVDAQKQADQQGVTLRLVTSAHCVDRALRACGLEQQFARRPDLESALAG